MLCLLTFDLAECTVPWSDCGRLCARLWARNAGSNHQHSQRIDQRSEDLVRRCRIVVFPSGDIEHVGPGSGLTVTCGVTRGQRVPTPEVRVGTYLEAGARG